MPEARPEPTFVEIVVTNYHNSDSPHTAYRITWSVDPEIPAREVDMRRRTCRESEAVGSDIAKGPKERDQQILHVLKIADQIAIARREAALEASEEDKPVSTESIAQLAARAAQAGDDATVALCGRALTGDKRARAKVETIVREIRVAAKRFADNGDGHAP